MPRFFLHILNSSGLAQDQEGADLPDLEAAREKAVDGIRSLLAEEVRGGLLNLRGRIDIADGAGKVLETVPFREAVELALDEESK